MKNKQSITILLLLALCAVFSGCTMDPDYKCNPQTFTYNLTEDEKSKVPYTGHDTLVFVSNTGDTAVCVGQGKQISYEEKNAGGSPDCGQDKARYESFKIIFSNMKGNLSYSITHVSLSRGINGININIFNKAFSFSSIIIDNTHINAPFYDSLVIHNRTYYNVSEINNEDGDILFFNKYSGLIQLQTKNNNKWTIK